MRRHELHDHEPGDLDAEDRGQVDLELERRRVGPGDLESWLVEHVAQWICAVLRHFVSHVFRVRPLGTDKQGLQAVLDPLGRGSAYRVFLAPSWPGRPPASRRLGRRLEPAGARGTCRFPTRGKSRSRSTRGSSSTIDQGRTPDTPAGELEADRRDPGTPVHADGESRATIRLLAHYHLPFSHTRHRSRESLRDPGGTGSYHGHDQAGKPCPVKRATRGGIRRT